MMSMVQRERERGPATPKRTVPPSGLKNGRLGDTQMQSSIHHKTSFAPMVKIKDKDGPSAKIPLVDLSIDFSPL